MTFTEPGPTGQLVSFVFLVEGRRPLVVVLTDKTLMTGFGLRIVGSYEYHVIAWSRSNF